MLAISRVAVAAIGALSLISVYQHWFALETLVETRGILARDAIGAANIRADIGGIFLAIALFAFVAAWRRSSEWLLATILLPATALLGRFVSAGIDGLPPGAAAPIAVEVVVIGILGSVLLYWRKMPEGL